MSSQKLKYTGAELLKKKNNKILRYPNLNTVLIVEKILEENRDMPLKISEVKKKLPKQIMHQTLQLILEYLWRSGKIIYGPRGVQWIYSGAPHLNKMFEDTLEV